MNSDQMEQRLKAAFPNSQVVVIDLTGTEDHWEVRISCESLKSLSRIERHQAVMKVFSAELKTGEVHALTIKVI